MGFTPYTIRKAYVTRLRNNAAKTKRVADMASGHGGDQQAGAEASPARWRSVYADIHDYEYVEWDEDDRLLRQARAGIVWAHRLWKREAPFNDMLLAIDHSLLRGQVTKEKNRVRKKEEVSKPFAFNSPVVYGEALRKTRSTPWRVPHQSRPVQALLAADVPRKTGDSTGKGGVEVAHAPDLKRKAEELRETGLLIRDVAREIGVPKPTVTRWLNPTLETRERNKAKERKFASKRRCPKCKRRMSNTSTRCQACFNAEQRYWTRERVIVAIQEWALKYGEPPRYRDWERSGGTAYPATSSLFGGPTRPFPSWNAAIEAAGFKPRQPGQRDMPLHERELVRKERAEVRRKAREEKLKRAIAKGE